MEERTKKEDNDFMRIKKSREDYLAETDLNDNEARTPARRNIRPRSSFLSFKDAINTITDFEGQHYILYAFCKSLEGILLAYGPECEQLILQMLPRKLKGKAGQIFGGSVLSYESLVDFIKALKLQFGAMQDVETVRTKLRNVAQYKNEPVEGYAIRVQLLQQKLLLIYEASTELDNHEKRRNKERAEQEAS